MSPEERLKEKVAYLWQSRRGRRGCSGRGDKPTSQNVKAECARRARDNWKSYTKSYNTEICCSLSCIICWLGDWGEDRGPETASLMMKERCNQLPARKGMKHVPRLMSYTGSANKVHSDFSIRCHRKTQPNFLANPIWLASNQSHNPQNLWFVT